MYVLALALQVAVFPYEEGLTNLVGTRNHKHLLCILELLSSDYCGCVLYAQAEAFSLVAVLGILVLAPWLAM